MNMVNKITFRVLDRTFIARKLELLCSASCYFLAVKRSNSNNEFLFGAPTLQLHTRGRKFSIRDQM